MLGSLFITSTIESIHEALTAAEVDGLVAVISQPRVGAGLVERGVSVLHVSARLRALRRLDAPRICAVDHRLPLAAGSVAAVVGSCLDEGATSDARLAEWSRVVKDGGAIVLADRGSATDHTRRALCAGLSELQQRHAGRTIVTSGLVSKLA